MSGVSSEIKIRGHQPLLHTTFYYAIEAALTIETAEDGEDPTPGEFDALVESTIGWVLQVDGLYDRDDNTVEVAREAAKYFWKRMQGSLLEELVYDPHYKPIYLVISTNDMFELTLVKKEGL